MGAQDYATGDQVEFAEASQDFARARVSKHVWASDHRQERGELRVTRTNTMPDQFFKQKSAPTFRTIPTNRSERRSRRSSRSA
jgi:hypothetical protein